MPRIVVVGSIHTDLVITTERLPARRDASGRHLPYLSRAAKARTRRLQSRTSAGEVCMVGRVGAGPLRRIPARQRRRRACARVHRYRPDVGSGVALITVERAATTPSSAHRASGCAP